MLSSLDFYAILFPFDRLFLKKRQLFRLGLFHNTTVTYWLNQTINSINSALLIGLYIKKPVITDFFNLMTLL